MRLCSCGFANADAASACTACGAPFATATAAATAPPPAAGNLILEDLRGGATITVTAPGGVLGRAGDFAPEAFSPRVSGVHAVVALGDTGRWTIEHTGRNASSVERAGVWTTLRGGVPHPLFGDETLKLADMVFRVNLTCPEGEQGATTVDCASAPDAPATENASASAAPDGSATHASTDAAPADPASLPRWTVRCPVCGTEHPVASRADHIDRCSFCSDPFDQRQIARAAARPADQP